MRFLVLLIILSAFSNWQVAQAAGARVAMVIGMDDYSVIDDSSPKPIDGSKGVAIALSENSAQFKVTHLTNPDSAKLAGALGLFLADAQEAECVIFYFSGFSIAANGDQQFLLADSNLEPGGNPRPLLLSDIVEAVEATQASNRVIIMDTGQKHPWWTDEIGLESVKLSPGTFLGIDRDPRHSANPIIFSSSLSKHLRTNGNNINQIFDQTRTEVFDQTTEMENQGLGISQVPTAFFDPLPGHQLFNFPPTTIVQKPLPPIPEANKSANLPEQGVPANTVVENAYHEVEVHFVTDRAPVPNQQQDFSADRNNQGHTLGLAKVSIPRGHTAAVVEHPQHFALKFSETPRHQVELTFVNTVPLVEFYAQPDRAQAVVSKETLLYVHGYNTGFEDALRQAAQLARDIDFGGKVIAYSWPSQNGAQSYAVDEVNANWSATNLTRFLFEQHRNDSTRTVHIVAHDLGARMLSQAIASIAKMQLGVHYETVVLASPDIDPALFGGQLASDIARVSKRTTLYRCSHSEAIEAAQSVHGGPLLGSFTNAPIFRFPGIDTIDAIGLDTAGSVTNPKQKPFISDLYKTITKRASPAQRNLVSNQPDHWILQSKLDSQLQTHVVKEGQTLYRISLLYQTSIDAIQHANQMRETKIFAGQLLVIPKN